MSESATAGARSSRIPFGIIRNHEAVRPRRSRHLNHARDRRRWSQWLTSGVRLCRRRQSR
ncbi:Conserved protein of unknown function [Mycobacterium canettii CIPT 140070017]|nr:Conserved protein of unknown function [Mycobacterium canettii CIPT 140070017]